MPSLEGVNPLRGLVLPIITKSPLWKWIRFSVILLKIVSLSHPGTPTLISSTLKYSDTLSVNVCPDHI